MRIVLLAHALRGSGSMVCCKSFLNALAQVCPQHQYLITAPDHCGYEDIVLPKNSNFYFCRNVAFMASPLSRFKLELKEIPAVVKAFGANVVLGLGCHGLLNIHCPQAIKIMNGYFVYPSKHFGNISLKERLQIKLQRFHLRRVLKNTSFLFCQTPVMRQRMSDYYDYDISKIKILPNAVSAFLQKPRSNDLGMRPKEIAEDKFNCFMLGAYYPHKNPEMILDACLPAYERFKDIRFITTISEQNSIHSKRFIQRLNKNRHLKRLIQNVGTIAHEELEAYYRNVQLVIMPTLMESFSVTYLEAMYFGVPILTTDLDFARYLCGDAAAYYNPWQPESFVEKLLMLKSDANAREKLVEAGYKQLKKFSSTWGDIVKIAISELESLVD